MKDQINDNQITFLIRGRYCGTHPSSRESITFKLIRSLEKFFPGSNIFFSTWENYKYNENLKAQHPRIKLIFSKEINDQSLEYGVGDLKHNYKSEFSLFEKTILIPFWGSVNSYKNPFSRSPNFPFHPSDMFHFGLTKDLKSYFDTPFMKNEDLQYFLYNPRGTSKILKIYDAGYLCRYLPEQYIFVSFLKRIGILSQSEFINMEDRPEKYKKLSHKLIVNNFFMVNFRELGASIQTPTNVRLLTLPDKYFNGRTIILSSLSFHFSRYDFISRRISYQRKIILSLKHMVLFLIECPIGLIYKFKNSISFKSRLENLLK